MNTEPKWWTEGVPERPDLEDDRDEPRGRTRTSTPHPYNHFCSCSRCIIARGSWVGPAPDMKKRHAEIEAEIAKGER